ncbi:DUF4198 domain-containing protein [Duganella sp. CY15W]|uniref:DUF4198 domain-containing protein n=1 Tax=Duganella sp. CY15W TaxID=2692172 RepID=UPI0013681F4A|nr:DUF4198 domain-containing protein [Duganella sp. CY15W]MYM28733.1 DUF4198 domain-containing protein [Duganella sp. CY15W]
MSPRYVIAVLTMLCQTTHAHDFWLQPERFHAAPGEPIPLTLQVGHGDARQLSPMPLRRITRFVAIAADGTATDLRPSLRLEGTAVGTYMLALESDNHAQSYLPAARFNTHLREEGLTQALMARVKSNTTGKDGSERYSRCAKAIIQVGQQAAGRVSEPLGLPLEIVPELNPYASPRAVSLPVDVLYAGAPLGGALVKLTSLDADAEPFEVRVTDSKGRAAFSMPQSGRWMLGVVWTQAWPPGSDIDYETVFSSLSFGFQ